MERRESVPGIVVLASGGGTNFQAILDAVRDGTLPARVTGLITDRPGTGAFQRAAAAGIPATVLHRHVFEKHLSDAIMGLLPEETKVIVLAGFLSILRGEILQHYAGRIINLHPSLLPRHGGPGMYGIRVHRAVLAAGDTESGCTVHHVDSGTDTGRIILQRTVVVLPGDTPEALAARIAPVEHQAILDGIGAVLTGVTPGSGDLP